MAGSAIRASHLTGDERVQDPYCLRCQPQVMGACLDLLRQAAATLADEANGVSDNPLIFADDRRGAVGRQFPRRAGRLRRRHDRAGDLRDRLARRAARRDAGRSGALRPAGVPDAEARPQLRLHDRAGDRRGAGLGKQAARLSRQRRFDPDLGQPGRPRLDGRAWRAAARADGRERFRRRSAIELLAAAQACDFHRAASLQRAAGGGARAAAPRGAAPRGRSLSSSRHRRRDAPRALAARSSRRWARSRRRRSKEHAR